MSKLLSSIQLNKMITDLVKKYQLEHEEGVENENEDNFHEVKIVLKIF